MPTISRGDYRRMKGQLGELGFGTYREFVDSTLWREFKKRYFVCHRRKCRACGKETDLVSLHHSDYTVLLNPMRVIPICNTCHLRIHKELEPKYAKQGVKVNTRRVCKERKGMGKSMTLGRLRGSIVGYHGTRAGKKCKSWQALLKSWEKRKGKGTNGKCYLDFYYTHLDDAIDCAKALYRCFLV